MKTGWKIAIVVLAALVVAGGIFTGAFFIGRATSISRLTRENPIGLQESMFERIHDRMASKDGGYLGISPRSGMKPGMGGVDSDRVTMGRGILDRDSWEDGRMGMFLSEGEISVQDAEKAAEKYLASLANDNLVVSETMIFNNGAYVVVKESDTGIGAMELLVDPNSLRVFPEPGPNHMWNLKYGSVGMMGHGYRNTPPESVDAEMSVTATQAVEKAQAYLDDEIKGATIEGDPVVFYGYYSLDFEKDGKIAGMLSVNGFTGQVWLHTWHGNFIEESMME